MILLAAVLRLARLDLTELHIDQAGALGRAENLVRLGQPPLEGARSSTALFLEPHFSYLLAPFVAISRDPAWVSAATAAADVAAVAGVLWLGWRAFGPLAGLVAAGLYAGSPAAVFYARRIWEPDIHPALAVLLVLALERGVLGRKSWWAAATFPITMLGVGVHFLFVMLAPLTLPAGVALVLRRRWLALAAGLATALLLVVPLLIHLRATDFQEYRDLRYRATLPARVDLEGLQFVFRVPTSWDGPIAEVLPLNEGLPAPLAEALPPISLGLLVASVVAAMARLVAPGTPRALRVRLGGLLVWLLLPAALTVRHQLDLHPHYYLMTLPASFLLIGAAAQWLVSALGRSLLALVGLVMAVLLGNQSVAVSALLGQVATTPQACYGAPLAVAHRTAAEVLAFGGRGDRLVFENDEAGDAAGIAYLARPGFAQIVVPQPDLAGLTGPGVPSATSEPAADRPPEQVDLTYGRDVRVQTASFVTDPSPGWRPRLVFAWAVQADAAAPLVWQADLLAASGQPALTHQGQRHNPASLDRHHQVVSVFSFDVPASLAPGDYTARLRLIGAPGEWLSPSVHVAPPPPCVRSVMP